MAVPRVPAGVTIDPSLFQRMAGNDGKLSSKEVGRSGLLPAPPKGYSYTYNHGNPSSPLALKKDGRSVIAKAGTVAKFVVPAVLAATGVGAPAAAAIMAATHAASKKADGGSWGDAVKAGAVGGATGYIGAGGVSSAGGKVAANAAVGGAQGAMDGGGIKGALVGAAGGAASSALAGGGTAPAGGTVNGLAITPYAPSATSNLGGTMAKNSGWGNVLKDLAKDPDTYRGIAAAAGGAGKGAADERGGANDFARSQNILGQQGHQTDIMALMQALGLNERATMDRAKLKIDAPQSRARQALFGSMLANAQSSKVTPPAGIRMGTVTGGMSDISGLLANARGSGRALASQAQTAIETGSDVPAYTDATSRLTSSPTSTGYQKPGGFESAASTSSLLASLLAAAAKQRKSGQPTTNLGAP